MESASELIQVLKREAPTLNASREFEKAQQTNFVKALCPILHSYCNCTSKVVLNYRLNTVVVWQSSHIIPKGERPEKPYKVKRQFTKGALCGCDPDTSNEKQDLFVFHTQSQSMSYPEPVNDGKRRRRRNLHPLVTVVF